MARRPNLLLTSLVVLLCGMACSAPPDKEMNQAQGAIDAARAAGADKYAADEYKAAVEALDRAHTAAGLRDYRLALSSALDARERAQEAARQAADRKAAARSQAERLVASVATAMQAGEARLKAADGVRVPAGQLAGPRGTLGAAAKAVQEARAALAREEYAVAERRLEGVLASVQQATAEIEASLETRPARPRGR